MKHELATVPKGIFAQLGVVSQPLYTLLVRGFSSRGDRFGISALCQRCQRSEKTIRRAITQGRSLGWVKSWRGQFENTVYSRHAPGPYVAVLDPVELDPMRAIHKVAIMVQLNDLGLSVEQLTTLTGAQKSSIYSAVRDLKSYGLIRVQGRIILLSSRAKKEIRNLSLLKKSMAGTTIPSPSKSSDGNRRRQVYDGWVSAGCPSLDSYDLDDAATIIMFRYAYLLDKLENVRCAVDGTKIADIKVILRWLSCPVDFGFSESESQRVLRITNGSPFQTALMAVDSLFTQAFSGFTFDFNVLFKFSEDKNNFDRFVIGSYLKSIKRPEWRSELLNRISGENDSESIETYEEFKSRLLGN